MTHLDLDGAETTEAIYVVTDEVTPLDEALAELRLSPASIGWGLYQITVRAPRLCACVLACLC